MSNDFKGIAVVFVFCSTFYSSTESVALTATESRSPGKAVPLAVKQTFWRILIVYIGIANFYGVTVPYDNSTLGSQTKTLKSPTSIALARVGWAGGMHLVNAFILMTCISAINNSPYIGSRTISHLAHEGLVPKYLGWTNRRGVPVPALILFNSLGVISLMNVSVGASNAYNYIVNLSGVGVFIVWAIISITHFRFRKAWVVQGKSVDELTYKTLFYPWTTIFSLTANIFLALVQGWTSLVPFASRDFFNAYILLPAVFLSYVGVNLLKNRGFGTVKVYEVNLEEGQRQDMDEESLKIPIQWNQAQGISAQRYFLHSFND